MTIDAVLAKARENFPTWQLLAGGAIRTVEADAQSPHFHLCPLEAAAGARGFWHAADRLGVIAEDRRAIVWTADNDRECALYQPELRAKMLAHFGLTENEGA